MISREIKKALSKLQSKKIERILVNVKSGEQHLVDVLKFKYYRRLLNNISLTKSQKKDIPEDFSEKSGKAAIIINTILTSTLGAWMGFYDYLNVELESLHQFWVFVIFAIVVSAAIGYLSFHSSNEDNKKSIRIQKINNLKVVLGKIIFKKRKSTAEKLINRCNDMLKNFYESEHWKKNIKLYVNSKTEKNDFTIIKLLLFDYVDKTIPLTELLKKLGFYFVQLNKESENPCASYVLNTLINVEKKAQKPDGQLKVWLAHHKKNIFVTFLPVLFGVFASSFVYLAGVPHLMEKYNLLSMNDMFKQAEIKWIGLIGITCITAYLAIISTQSIYRLYKRSTHLNKSIIHFNHIEDNISEINKINSRLRQFICELKTIFIIKNMIENNHRLDLSQNNQSLSLL